LCTASAQIDLPLSFVLVFVYANLQILFVRARILTLAD